MAYSEAVFYVDPDTGSDAVRATLSAVVFSNPSGDVVRGTYVSHGLEEGAVIDVTGTTNGNGPYKVTLNDADTFDLVGASWAAFNGADVTGDVVPRGGASWSDAWATLKSGATAARVSPLDLIKHAKSPDPSSIGTADWTGGPAPDAEDIESSTNASPIVVTITGHTISDGDFVQVLDHETNTAANGIWRAINTTADTLELEGTTGNGVGGATGTLQKVSHRVVYIASIMAVDIDRCETGWTAKTGLITSVVETPSTAGTGYSVNDVLTLTEGTGGTVVVTAVGGSGEVTAVDLVSSGYGYTTGTGKATSGGGGAGCEIEIDGAGDVTVEYTDSRKEGQAALKITPPAGATGDTLLAYKAVSPGSLASYQQLSFWVFEVGQGVIADEWAICLCSDGSGETVVDEFVLDGVGDANNPVPNVVTKTGGGNLGASTASVAVYAGSAGTRADNWIVLDNLLATVTNSLNLLSLISKSSSAAGGDEPWHTIQSIRGRIVVLDSTASTTPSSSPSEQRGYSGDTESVTTYIRRCFTFDLETSDSIGVNELNASGEEGSHIYVSGGWNVATDTQDGETYFDGRNGHGIGLRVSQRYFADFERFSFLRFAYGVKFINYPSFLSFEGISNLNHNTRAGLSTEDGSNNELEVGHLACNEDGIRFIGGRANRAVVQNIAGNAVWGAYFEAADDNRLEDAVIRNNGQCGIAFLSGNGNRLIDIETADNRYAAISMVGGRNHLRNATLGESAEVYPSVYYGDPVVLSHNHNGGGTHKHLLEMANIYSLATNRPGGTGSMWKIAIDGAVPARTESYPAVLWLRGIGVYANRLATLRLWVRRDTTNVTAKLIVPGGQIAGVDADVEATLADGEPATSWQWLKVSFTPTADGVVVAKLIGYYLVGNGNVYAEDLSAGQA